MSISGITARRLDRVSLERFKTQSSFTATSESVDLPAAIAALDQDVVFHSPILATTGDEVRGHPILAKILQTAFACYGMPRNVEEFQNPDGRYIVTFDGSIDGNLIQIAILVQRMLPKRWKASACSRAHGRSSSCSASSWSVTCVRTRSPEGRPEGREI